MSRALLAVLLLLGGGSPFLSASGVFEVVRTMVAVTGYVGGENDPNGRPQTGSIDDPNGGPQTDVGGENDPDG